MNNNPHLIVKDINGRDALAVLEPVQIDRSLPKYAVSVDTSSLMVQGSLVLGTSTNSGWVTINNSGIGWNQNGLSNTLLVTPTEGLFTRLWKAIRNIREGVRVKANTVPVQDTFVAILGNGKKLEVLNGRLEAHQDAIAEAKKMGQTALAEQLEKRTQVVEMEAVLFAAGYKDYISEADLIHFVKTCERGLRLDYIKNFTRLIPENVRAKKLKMDALKVFDAYVILHYDPENKGAELTQKEIEKKKDPILFGLVNGSRRLYHVGSWKDEYCDLTFGDLIDKFGKETLTLQ